MGFPNLIDMTEIEKENKKKKKKKRRIMIYIRENILSKLLQKSNFSDDIEVLFVK